MFFIPVIPLGQAPEHVQCTDCGTRYSSDVLALPTMAQMQAALPAGMRAAAIAMLRAGEPGSARRAAGPSRRSGAPGCADYDDAALEADLAQAVGPGAGSQIAGRLNALAAQLAVPAREWFLAEVVRIGLADGALTESERRRPGRSPGTSA